MIGSGHHKTKARQDKGSNIRQRAGTDKACVHT